MVCTVGIWAWTWFKTCLCPQGTVRSTACTGQARRQDLYQMKWEHCRWKHGHTSLLGGHTDTLRHPGCGEEYQDATECVDSGEGSEYVNAWVIDTSRWWTWSAHPDNNNVPPSFHTPPPPSPSPLPPPNETICWAQGGEEVNWQALMLHVTATKQACRENQDVTRTAGQGQIICETH